MKRALKDAIRELNLNEDEKRLFVSIVKNLKRLLKVLLPVNTGLLLLSISPELPTKSAVSLALIITFLSPVLVYAACIFVHAVRAASINPSRKL